MRLNPAPTKGAPEAYKPEKIYDRFFTHDKPWTCGNSKCDQNGTSRPQHPDDKVRIGNNARTVDSFITNAEITASDPNDPNSYSTAVTTICPHCKEPTQTHIGPPYDEFSEVLKVRIAIDRTQDSLPKVDEVDPDLGLKKGP